LKTKYTEFIIDCLNGRINPETIEKIRQDEWQPIIELAKKKQLSAIIFFNLKQSNLLHSLPTFVNEELENAHYCVLTQNTIILKELTKLLKALNQLDIKPIILKGVALINTVYDGNFSLRPMVDIDILIPPEQLGATKQCLKELGYEIDMADFGSTTYKLKDNENLNLLNTPYLEIHWHILHKKFNRVLNIDERIFWQRAKTFKMEDVDYLGLSCEDNILYLSLHLILIHFFSNILWLYDIKRIIETQKDDISWDRLLKTANDSGTRNVIYYCLAFCKDILGVSLDTKIIERFSPSSFKKKTISCFLKKDYILENSDLDRVSYIVQLLMLGMKEMIKLAITNIFPDRELLAYRYPNEPYFKAYLTYVLRPLRILLATILCGKQRAFN